MPGLPPYGADSRTGLLACTLASSCPGSPPAGGGGAARAPRRSRRGATRGGAELLIHARLILNPAAGRGAGRRALDPVTREFQRQGWAVDVAYTEGPGHGADLAVQAVADGARRVVVVGGDGTVHDVANGLLRQAADVTLGVVPIGTGNDFAKLVGVYRHSPVRAVRRLVTAQERRFDVGTALDEYFVNSLGFGFGPEVVRVRNAMPQLKGFLSYLIPVLRAFAAFRPRRFEVRAPGFAETGYMMMVEICNGTTAGGSYKFAPGADPSDGRLDVCLVRKVSLPRFLMAVPRVMRGTHTRMREVALFQAPEVTIRCTEGPFLWHSDGELRESAVGECTVRLERRKLTVLVAR